MPMALCFATRQLSGVSGTAALFRNTAVRRPPLAGRLLTNAGVRCHHVLSTGVRHGARTRSSQGRRCFSSAVPSTVGSGSLLPPSLLSALLELKDSPAWLQFKALLASLWPKSSAKGAEPAEDSADDDGSAQGSADDTGKETDAGGAPNENAAGNEPSSSDDKSSVAESAEAAFTYKELFKLLLPDALFLFGAIMTAIGAAAVNIQLPLVLGQLVNVIASHDTTAESFIDAITPAAGSLIKLYAVQAILTCSYISLLSALGERMAARLRQDLFRSLLVQDVAFFDAHKTGEVVNRLTADVQDFKSSFKQCISQGLRSATQTIGCGITLYMISPKLAGLLGVCVPIMVVTGTLLGAGLRKMSAAAQAQVAKATSLANEVLGNIRTVRAFAMEDAEDRAYSREVERSSSLYQGLGLGIGVFQGLSNFAINGMILIVLFFGGSMMSQRQLTAGDLMSFLVATQTMQRSMAQVSVLFGQAVRGMSAGNRVFEYMKLHPSIPVRGGATISADNLHGDLRLNNVKFIYPTRPEQVVLDDLSLHIPAGKTVALCGPSGGGKTTIAALIERFYDPVHGAVTLDGVDIRTLDPCWLRTNVLGYINQEPVLFATSVMENIRYGRPGASDQEVISAAKSANVDGFVRSFPNGYDTLLGERGMTVSGGQRQRIAIARALLKNPKVLLLDEATSALDAESEHVVQEALNKLCEGRTVIVIAHRLSTIRNADTIGVVVKGRIVEQGSHARLVSRKNGVYADLIRRQASGSSPSAA
eukprot:scpid34684/ scgid2622/ ATP-binding cassette sub-family B member 8, mitochondrial